MRQPSSTCSYARDTVYLLPLVGHRTVEILEAHVLTAPLNAECVDYAKARKRRSSSSDDSDTDSNANSL